MTQPYMVLRKGPRIPQTHPTYAILNRCFISKQRGPQVQIHPNIRAELPRSVPVGTEPVLFHETPGPRGSYIYLMTYRSEDGRQCSKPLLVLSSISSYFIYCLDSKRRRRSQNSSVLLPSSTCHDCITSIFPQPNKRRTSSKQLQLCTSESHHPSDSPTRVARLRLNVGEHLS